MSKVVGHAPLLLTLLMGNNNLNHQAMAGTTVVQEQVVEADYLRDLTGGSQDNNNKNAAISGTVGVHDHVKEVDYLHDKANESIDAGVLHLRGESPPPQALSQAQCESYNQDGYLILSDALTVDQAAELLGEARDVMKRISEGGEGIIRHDVSGSDAKKLSPVGRVLATFEPESLNYSNARITQSQIIAKLAGIGGEIVPHQDGCVSFTNPPSGLTFWYALENTTLENGCLRVAAGSHLTEPLRQRLITGDDGQPKFEDLKAPLWARGGPSAGLGGGPSAGVEAGQQTEYVYRALEVKKGTLVLFHGNLMHKSGVNKSEKNRIAYTFSIIDGDAECPDDNHLKPREGDFERL